MNPRILRALLFEQVFRTGPLLLAGLCIGALAVFAADRLNSLDGSFLANHEIVTISQLAAFFIAIGTLLYTTSTADKLTCGIPPSILLLPVSTTAIVLVRFLWGAVAMLSISFVLQKIELALLDGPIRLWWVFGAQAVAAYAILQTVALSVSRWGDLSLGVLVVTLAAVFWFADTVDPGAGMVGYLAASAAVLGVCAAIACGIVTLQRRETNIDLVRFLPFTITIQRREADRPPFRSPQAAQRWLETMRLCTSFPALFLALLGISYLLEYAPQVDPTNTFVNLLGSHHLDHPEFFKRSLIASAAGAGAITAFLNFRLLAGPLRNFYFLRPMSTRDLASARLLSTIRVLLVPLCLLGLWLVITVAMDVRAKYLFYQQPRIDMEPDQIIHSLTYHFVRQASSAMQFFMSTLASAWMLFWTTLVAIGLSVFIFAGSLFNVALSIGWIDDNHGDILIATLIVIYVLLMALILRSAQRLGILNKRLLNTSLGIGFGLTLVLVGLTETYHWFLVAEGTVSANEITPLSYVRNDGPTFLFALAFCALPFATIPLTLHWTRHR